MEMSNQTLNTWVYDSRVQSKLGIQFKNHQPVDGIKAMELNKVAQGEKDRVLSQKMDWHLTRHQFKSEFWSTVYSTLF